MAGAYLLCRQFDFTAGPSPAEVGIVRGGLFYERIGNTFGTRHNNAVVNTYRAPNKAVQYFSAAGGEVLFALAETGTTGRIWSFDGVSTWSVAHDPGSGTGGDQVEGFLHVTGSDGLPYLVHTARSTPINGIGRARYDGTSWVNDIQGFGVSIQTISYAHKGIVHSKLFRTSGGSWEWSLYDVVTRALSFQTVNPAGGNLSGCPVYFTLGDRLFMLAAESGASGGITLEFVLGSWIENTSAAAAQWFGANNSSSSHAAFRISDTKVLIIGPGNPAASTTATGMVATLCQIVAGVPTYTDVTDPVIPPFLRPGTAVGDPQDYGCYGMTDNDQVPGTPEFFVYFCSDMQATSAAWNLLQVTDELTELQIIDVVQADNSWSAPALFQGGGQQSFIAGEISGIILDTVQAPLGLRIDYQVFGDPGPTDKTVAFRFINSFGVPVTIGSLVPGSATGGTSTVVGNEVQSVNADPSIAYSVVWDFLSDGVPDGSQPSVVAVFGRP